jgi:ketosteroid isomerase-like protein
METTYHGLEGFIQSWRDWLEPWASYRTEVEDLIDLDDRVLVLVRARGRRADTEAEVEAHAASIWTVRDGRVAQLETYANRAEALEAAGLSDG